MIKKILPSLLLIFLFSSISLAEELKNENLIKQKGPTSTPKIVGPKTTPPTKNEIKKIKCEKDTDFIGTKYCEEKKEKKIGFWEWFWNWIKDIF